MGICWWMEGACSWWVSTHTPLAACIGSRGPGQGLESLERPVPAPFSSFISLHPELDHETNQSRKIVLQGQARVTLFQLSSLYLAVCTLLLKLSTSWTRLTTSSSLQPHSSCPWMCCYLFPFAKEYQGFPCILFCCPVCY